MGIFVWLLGIAGFLGTGAFAWWASYQLDRDYFPRVWAAWGVSLFVMEAGVVMVACGA